MNRFLLRASSRGRRARRPWPVRRQTRERIDVQSWRSSVSAASNHQQGNWPGRPLHPVMAGWGGEASRPTRSWIPPHPTQRAIHDDRRGRLVGVWPRIEAVKFTNQEKVEVIQRLVVALEQRQVSGPTEHPQAASCQMISSTEGRRGPPNFGFLWLSVALGGYELLSKGERKSSPRAALRQGFGVRNGRDATRLPCYKLVHGACHPSVA